MNPGRGDAVQLCGRTKEIDDGLRSVAHLGGKGGMAKFVKSSGKRNPADELGTSLQDYY